MRRTTNKQKTEALRRLGRRRQLTYLAVAVIAAFTVIGGWMYIQASRAASLPDEYALDDRVQDLFYTTSPVDLQAEILRVYKAEAPDCVKDDVLIDYYGNATDLQVVINTDGFAVTSLGCKTSSELMLARTVDGWQKVGTRHFEYKCDELKAHNVPLWFLQALVNTDEAETDEDMYNPTITCIPSTPGATSSVVYEG